MWNELYHDIIVDHSRHSAHRQSLEQPCERSCGYNPMCGDEVTIWMRLRDEKLEKVVFEGQGCAISQASASLTCAYLQGLEMDAAVDRIENMIALLTGLDTNITEDELMALSEIKQFPMRVKCATMAWHAALDILKNK